MIWVYPRCPPSPSTTPLVTLRLHSLFHFAGVRSVHTLARRRTLAGRRDPPGASSRRQSLAVRLCPRAGGLWDVRLRPRAGGLWAVRRWVGTRQVCAVPPKRGERLPTAAAGAAAAVRPGRPVGHRGISGQPARRQESDRYLLWRRWRGVVRGSGEFVQRKVKLFRKPHFWKQWNISELPSYLYNFGTITANWLHIFLV